MDPQNGNFGTGQSRPPRFRATDSKRFRIVADYERGRDVFDRLLAVFRERRYPFEQYRPFNEPLLERPLPEDPLARSLFWQHLCFWMRGRIESYEALWRLARVYHDEPELFVPASWDSSRRRVGRLTGRLVELADRHGLSVGVEKYHKNDWRKNAVKLHRHWGGDPRNLATSTRTFDDLRGRIQNRDPYREDHPNGFRGFQIKMVAMWAHFHSIDGLAHPEEFPFPVDIHVGRFLLYHRIIDVEVLIDGRWRRAEGPWDILYDWIVEPAVELCLRYLKERGVSAVELGEAVWNFAQLMCGEAPQNFWAVGEGSGRKTILTPIRVQATESNRRRYHATCGACPVRSTCREGSIGGAPYFRWGTFSYEPEPVPLDRMFEPALAGIVPAAFGRPLRAWRRMAEGRPLGPGDWLDRRRIAAADDLTAPHEQLELAWPT